MYSQPRKRLCIEASHTPITSPADTPAAVPDPAAESIAAVTTAAVPITPNQPHPEDAPPSAAAAAAARRLFPCRVCDARLSTSSNRSRHERLQHKATFSQRGLKRHHAVTPPPSPEPSDSESDSESDSSDEEDSECAPESSDVNTSNTHSEAPLEGHGDPAHPASAAVAAEAANHLIHDGAQMEIDQAQPLIIPASAEEQNARYEAQVLEETKLHARAMKELTQHRPLLLDTEMQQTFFPFLTWLSQPAITSCEILVKVRRINSHAQLQPIKYNLRFIFSLLYERQVVSEVSIDALSKTFVCTSLYEAMKERQVGSARIHAIFLLVKKVLVYLSSKESVEKRQFILPSTIESYFYVESICSDHGQKRKQESRNRIMLGAEESRTIAQSLGRPERFEIPSSWTATPPPAVVAEGDHRDEAKTRDRNPAAPKGDALPSSSSTPAAGVTMTKAELQRLAQACLAVLNAPRWKQPPIAHQPTAAERDGSFAAHLVTATLCLGLAPRSQVLKQLQVGSSFTKSDADGRYYVKILAEMSKNGKPTTFALPIELTPAYDLYLEVIRPRMLERGLHLTKPHLRHKYVFFKRNGQAPRAEFSSLTSTVTQSILGRSINAHAFRAAVITTYYQAGASQAEMDTLASIMAHDSTTARNAYFRPQFHQVAAQANDKMSDILLH